MGQPLGRQLWEWERVEQGQGKGLTPWADTVSMSKIQAIVCVSWRCEGQQMCVCVCVCVLKKTKRKPAQ